MPDGDGALPQAMAVKTENKILKYFKCGHLPGHLQSISQPFCDMAHDLDKVLQDSAEKTVCLRKLLESKDAAVRAAIPD